MVRVMAMVMAELILQIATISKKRLIFMITKISEIESFVCCYLLRH